MSGSQRNSWSACARTKLSVDSGNQELVFMHVDDDCSPQGVVLCDLPRGRRGAAHDDGSLQPGDQYLHYFWRRHTSNLLDQVLGHVTLLEQRAEHCGQGLWQFRLPSTAMAACEPASWPSVRRHPFCVWICWRGRRNCSHSITPAKQNWDGTILFLLPLVPL